MGVDRAALPDRQWATSGALAGLCGILSYGLLIAFDASAPVSALLTCVFSFGFILATIGIYLGVIRTVAPRLGLLAAVANTVAGAELTAMLLVQIAVRAASPRPGSALTGIWLGLDVAWDVFGGTGTVLLALGLWRHSRFGPVLAASGMLAGAAIVTLNIVTFPTPPAEAGLIDVGPLVALWFVVLCVWVLWVAGRGRGGEPIGAIGEAPGRATIVGAAASLPEVAGVR